MLHIVAIVSDNTTDIETTTNRLLRPELFNQLAQWYEKNTYWEIFTSHQFVLKQKIYKASDVIYLTVKLEPTSHST